jgi:hypothetical protein
MYRIAIKHEFGSGTLRELASLYKNPIAAIREAVSNGLDAMVPYAENHRIEIHTNVPPHGDIEIEDWGTGIEDFNLFKYISVGQKVVANEISSYEKVNAKIIGQKGVGKASFLKLSEDESVEFYSNSGKVGMYVAMTFEGFTEPEYQNSSLVLPHHGLKVVIKHAKKLRVTDLRNYLSKTFAIRLDRGTKIILNDEPVHSPDGFDSKWDELFVLGNGSKVMGNLVHVERPEQNNIDIFVKRVFVDSIPVDFKVEGWINCDDLVLQPSREGVYEGNEIYEEFMRKLIENLDKNFERKSEGEEKRVRSSKQIAKMFVSVIKSIHDLYPDMAKPLIYGNPSDQKERNNLTKIRGGNDGPLIKEKGTFDKTGTDNSTIGKPLQSRNGTKQGNGKPKNQVSDGDEELLLPSILLSGGDTIPEPKVVVVDVDGKPVVFFSAPHRLVINSKRPSSHILTDARPKDPTMKSRVLPLLVRAGIDAFPGSFEMTREEWFRRYDAVLDSVWSK